MAVGRRIAAIVVVVLALSGCATLTDVSKPAGDHTAGSAFMAFGESGPLLSGDGRYSVFEGPRSSLDGTGEVYRHDALTDATVRVSVDSSGAPVGGTGPAISRDGRFVAFVTAAPLVADDTNADAAKGWPGWDVYVRDLDSGTVTRASVDDHGVQLAGAAANLVPVVHLSADGRYVAFSTRMDAGRTFTATYYVRDRQAPGSTVVGSGYGDLAAMSGDGLHVLINNFTACLTICPPPPGGTVVDWKDGTSANLACQAAGGALSDDGRYLAVFQAATSGCTPGLVRIDRSSGAVDPFPGNLPRLTTESGVSMTGDGNRIAVATDDAALADDTNGVTDVYVGDFASGDVGIASRTVANGPADGASRGPSISADGRYVVFTTDATDLLADDLNAATDVVETPAMRPTVDRLTPAGLARGTTASNVRVVGTGFTTGGTVTMGPGVAVSSVQVVDPHEISLTVTVAADAEVGARNVQVVWPGPYGSAAGYCFACLAVT